MIKSKNLESSDSIDWDKKVYVFVWLQPTSKPIKAMEGNDRKMGVGCGKEQWVERKNQE